MLRSAFALIGLLILCGCVPERCDTEIDRETAVKVAREYFLTRSLAQLEAGTAADRKEASLMRRAGMTEVTYRETFQRAIPGRGRFVGRAICDHPLIYYQADHSLNYNGFDAYFSRVTPAINDKDWHKSVTGVNITRCGRLGGYFFTYDYNGFRRGIADPRKLGFVPCQDLSRHSEK
jgi:hypothetical protein